MKRVLLTVAIALLIPGLLGAATATMGLYDAAGKLYYEPSNGVPFQLYMYLIQSDYYVTSIEYQLIRENSYFTVQSVEYPSNVGVVLGDPLTGHSVTYWPPMSGIPNGYDMMMTLNCVTSRNCTAMKDYELIIGVYPGSGELRGTYDPEGEFFPIVGLTTYLCLDQVGTEEEGSWGAIKSLYR
ncbi:MAG: hypothetical protein JW746_09755 [Candidatus Krumholzibacteriota bacterium]|nr:hypothetical protein [Candidatus Krumholzibacteriota bacterium]